MIRTGKELDFLLNNLGLKRTDYEWFVPRKKEKNLNLKITGIIITGYLDHQVIGEALSAKKNVIIASNKEFRFKRYQILENLGEIIYKNELYLILWNEGWIYSNLEGELIISKIFNFRYENMVRNKLGYQIFSKTNVTLRSIVHRFKEIQILSLAKIRNNIEFKNYLITSGIEEYIETSDKRNGIILSIGNIPDKIIKRLLKNFKYIILIDETDFLNEVSRELYFLIKQGEELDIDISFNAKIFRKIEY